MSTDWIWDIENYPNYFCAGFEDAHSDQRYYFEISPRRDDRWPLINFITSMSGRMVGYNSIGYDYPVTHYLLENPHASNQQLYEKGNAVITAEDRFAHTVWPSDWVKPQVDLYKLHHFDNVNRATSLKMLEFNMRLKHIADLPIAPGTVLTNEQMDQIAHYNMNRDLPATKRFYHLSTEKLDFRAELSEKYGKDFTNHNDTKIGKDIFIMKLGNDVCYERVNGRREPLQSPRTQINLVDVVFPYIKFERPEFQSFLEWLKQQTVYETKGVFKDLSVTVDGFKFVFGTGGIHASIESSVVESDDEYIIDDRDVASYYPNLAIVNKLYPEHLGQYFCDIFLSIYEDRQRHPKDTHPGINKALKLALNGGGFGDTNNQYGPFYDPLYFLRVTINGQLLLCMLSEELMKVPGLTMIQANTDGVTVRYPRKYIDRVDEICKWWERFTMLELESVKYRTMAIKNVNAYLAVTESGKIKRNKNYCTLGAHVGKGADLDWHQPHSSLVVPMAAEAALLLGADIREFITSHADVMDFMRVVKAPRSCRLELGERQIQNTTRYFISIDGEYMNIIRPPKGKKYEWLLKNPETGKTKTVKSQRGVDSNAEKGFTEIISCTEIPPKDRVEAVCKGWRITEANDLPDDLEQLRAHINYEWYIAEAKKLVDPLVRVG